MITFLEVCFYFFMGVGDNDHVPLPHGFTLIFFHEKTNFINYVLKKIIYEHGRSKTSCNVLPIYFLTNILF